MKRIKLTEKLEYIVMNNPSVNTIVKELKKFISENYRRRVYHKKGYTCNNCGYLNKAGAICTCKMKGA